MKKAWVAIFALLLFLGLSANAFAINDAQGVKAKHDRNDPNKSCKLESIIKDSLKKNNGDLAKVKEDVAKFLANKKLEREARLQEIAKKKGLTVDELKAKMSEKRQQKLQEKATQKGVSLEELKKQMISKHEQRLSEMAKTLGISVEQLKQILPDPK